MLVGSKTVQPVVDSNSPGQAEAFRYSAAASGTASTAWLYLDSSNTASSASLGVYADQSGSPGALLGQVTMSAPTAGAWNKASISVPITAGTTYWLAVLQPAGSSGSIQLRDSNGGSSMGSSQTNLTALTSTWSPGPVWPSSTLSAYLS
jgi:hypothetical protein